MGGVLSGASVLGPTGMMRVMSAARAEQLALGFVGTVAARAGG